LFNLTRPDLNRPDSTNTHSDLTRSDPTAHSQLQLSPQANPAAQEDTPIVHLLKSDAKQVPSSLRPSTMTATHMPNPRPCPCLHPRPPPPPPPPPPLEWPPPARMASSHCLSGVSQPLTSAHHLC
jgi:hypothetical protein